MVSMLFGYLRPQCELDALISQTKGMLALILVNALLGVSLNRATDKTKWKHVAVI